MKKTFSFSAKVWLYPGKAAWHFISVPTDITEEIDYYYAHKKRGWRSLRVAVTIGGTVWQTSIFSDKKTATYLLPLKADVRKREHLAERDLCHVALEILE